jgi:uncharacterized cupin superfamily protein
VLDGALRVRLPDSDIDVDRGALMRFAPGPSGAHQITNRGAVKARVLLFSRATLPSIGVYPDSDAIGVWPDDDTEFYFRRSDAVAREDVV